MKTNRIATFGGFDRIHKQKMDKKKEANQRQIERLIQQKKTKETILLASSSGEETQLTLTILSVNWRLVVNFLISHHPRHKEKKLSLRFFQPGIPQSQKLTSVAARIKMTQAQQQIYTKSLIEEGGGDPTKLPMSHSWMDKSCRIVAKNIVATTKELSCFQ